MSYTPKGTSSSPEYTRLTDDQMSADVHVSHFGALKTSPTIPVLKANFPGIALDTSVWTQTVANGGSTTVGQGVGSLQTSTNSAGSVKLVSVDQGIFEAGQVTVYQSGVYAGAPIANNIRRWGLMTADEQNGLFFELNGLDFNVVARAGGTDTRVESASFSGDTAFTPGASNNTYRIHYSAGRAIFSRASAGKHIMLHTMVDSDYPLAEDLDLGLFYENTNTGNTTNVELRVRGASTSLFGHLPTIRANENFTDDSVVNKTKSIITGRDSAGGYQNVQVSMNGAILTGNFSQEVALGNVTNQSAVNKFGRNPTILTNSTPEDVWEGGGLYTGFPTGSPETVDVVSSDTNDTSAGTGARTVRITGLASSAATSYTQEIITLNGTTPVTSTGSWYRVNRVEVLTAGSGGENAGVITVDQTTSGGVFAAVPTGLNQSAIGAYTIPASNQGLLIAFNVIMSRTNGSAGSAHVTLRRRSNAADSVFNTIASFEITNQLEYKPLLHLPIILNAGDDIVIRVENVSDNTTSVTCNLELILVNNS